MQDVRKDYELTILCGGQSSSEKEISLLSGENVYEHCKPSFNVKKIVLEHDDLPDDIKHDRDSIILPMMHGEFGEDGQLQAIMEMCGLTFIGSGSNASAMCMDKTMAKDAVSRAGVPVIDGIKATKLALQNVQETVSILGSQLFIKPNNKGSSIDVHVVTSVDELQTTVGMIDDSTEYIVERNVDGCDMTVGILDGKALEIVEIRPKHGIFTYENKYTAGLTDEICPARIPQTLSIKIKRYAEMAYSACGCRDFARADFILTGNGEIFFLELNTLPGMTSVSLYPKSSRAAGIEIDMLVEKLMALAISRREEHHNISKEYEIAATCNCSR